MSLWVSPNFVHVPIEEYRRLKDIEASAMHALTVTSDLLAGEKSHGVIRWHNDFSANLMVSAMAELAIMLGLNPDGCIAPRHLV